ncbi:MAG: hypothetical protein M1820_007740 [Bogoriella megaspora]|nr:MAG: hypothetical protein M1820_007740 [Bogoriella megaspora]
MESHEPMPSLSEATQAAIQRAVQRGIEAALPGVVDSITESLQDRTHLTSASKEGRSESLTPFTVDDPEELLARALVAQALKMNEHTTHEEFIKWKGNAEKTTVNLQIGIRSPIKYAIRLAAGEVSEDVHCPALGHNADNDNETLTGTLCICRANANLQLSHSLVCPDNIGGASYDNDLGRLVLIGILFSKEPGKLWRELPFKVFRSLTEGGLWIISSLRDRNSSIEEYHGAEKEYSNEGTWTASLRRARPLPGFEDVALARLPDFVSSGLPAAKIIDSRDMRDPGLTPANDNDTEQLDRVGNTVEIELEQQYSGLFVLKTPRRW